MTPVTDPSLLAQLEGNTKGKRVTDPKILAKLEGQPDAFKRFGKYIPTAGAVVGGLAGGTLGGLPAIGGAALGAGAGEAGRQILGRLLGEPSPQTSGQAAKQIGIQGAAGGAGEVLGQGVGALGGMAWRGLPKVAQAISGTPARNIAKAQMRGFGETYFPSIAKGLSREVAGAEKGGIEDALLARYFKPDEISKIKLNKTGYANQVVENAYAKFIGKQPLSVPEALKTVKSIDSVYRDTPIGMKTAPELSKLRRYADQIVSTAHPEYKLSKRASEATILRSQLLKPFRVNKTRPDELSGFSGALGGFKPAAYLATAPFSPLSFGVGASALGSARQAISPLVRKAIQRALIQSGIQITLPEGTLQQ